MYGFGYPRMRWLIQLSGADMPDLKPRLRRNKSEGAFKLNQIQQVRKLKIAAAKTIIDFAHGKTSGSDAGNGFSIKGDLLRVRINDEHDNQLYKPLALRLPNKAALVNLDSKSKVAVIKVLEDAGYAIHIIGLPIVISDYNQDVFGGKLEHLDRVIRDVEKLVEEKRGAKSLVEELQKSNQYKTAGFTPEWSQKELEKTTAQLTNAKGVLQGLRLYRANYVKWLKSKDLEVLLRIPEALQVVREEIRLDKIGRNTNTYNPQKEANLKRVLAFRKQASKAFNQADAIISILIKIRESERVNEAEARNLSGR